MKQIIYRMFLVMSLCAATIGCDDNFEDIEGEYYPTDIEYGNEPLYFRGTTTFAGDGESGSFAVFAFEQMPWQFTGVPSWLTLSQTHGNGNIEGTYNVGKNPSVSVERSAYYYLQSTLETFPIKYSCYARQYVQPKTFSVTPKDEYFEYGPEGGELKLDIKTNRGWHLRRPASQTGFLIFSTKKDSADCVLTVTVPAYDYLDGVSRSNTFYFYDNDATTKLHIFQITQTPPESSTGVIQKNLKFIKEGSSQTVTLGTASSYTVQCDLAWATVTSTSGTGTVELEVSVLPNTTTESRDGYAYVYVGGSVKAKIHISQAGHQFSVSRKTWYVGAAGGTQTLGLSSDGAWKATSSADWVTVSPATGNTGGEQEITITASANKSMDNRRGDILFERTDGVVAERILEITQYGRYFSPGDWKAGVVVGPDAQTVSHEFNGDLAWTASTSDSWITLTKASGSPATDHKVSFTVTANTAQESRVGEILVTYEGGETKIPVVQESAYINTSSSTISLPSTGGGHDVSISSNGQWTATSDATWLTLSNTSGNGNVKMTLTATDNLTPDDRTATITLTMGTTNTQKKLSVTQKGRYMKVPVTTVNFFLKGGEQRFDIDSDGKLVATSSDSWLTANIETGNILVLKANENKSGQPRSATVTIYVSGLTSGELKQVITVNQLNTNVIERVEFGDDESIDLGTGGQSDIDKGQYGNDKELNLTPTGGVTVDKTGFGADKDLN